MGVKEKGCLRRPEISEYCFKRTTEQTFDQNIICVFISPGKTKKAAGQPKIIMQVFGGIFCGHQYCKVADLVGKL